ncbi:hypothetical protein LIER_37560 [Lithospermum erythrorhizon]|uniref:Uncharacterized protein n=1 Tax=Lithospermum erythrorhizon TaxID=34254 RepID=A0AAV3PM42_LITER
MKDLGSLKYFFGIEVARSSKGIYLCQWKYVLDIIEKCGLLGGRHVDFPMVPNHKLGESTSEYLADGEQFRRLKAVSLSSAKAEYRSLTAVTCELKWLKGLLSDFGVSSGRSVPVYSDSQSTLHLAHNPVFHERSKHIEPLGQQRFEFLLRNLGICDLHAPT